MALTLKIGGLGKNLIKKGFSKKNLDTKLLNGFHNTIRALKIYFIVKLDF